MILILMPPKYFLGISRQLTFVGSCHFIRLERGILDTVMVFYKECSFMFKKIIYILYAKIHQK